VPQGSGVVVLKNEFPRLAVELQAGGKLAEANTARAIAAKARGHVRVRTGRTRDSIRAEADSASAGGAGLYLEFGTSRMPAFPFFFSAVTQEQPRFVALLLAILRRHR